MVARSTSRDRLRLAAYDNGTCSSYDGLASRSENPVGRGSNLSLRANPPGRESDSIVSEHANRGEELLPTRNNTSRDGLPTTCELKTVKRENSQPQREKYEDNASKPIHGISSYPGAIFNVETKENNSAFQATTDTQGISAGASDNSYSMFQRRKWLFPEQDRFQVVDVAPEQQHNDVTSKTRREADEEFRNTKKWREETAPFCAREAWSKDRLRYESFEREIQQSLCKSMYHVQIILWCFSFRPLI